MLIELSLDEEKMRVATSLVSFNIILVMNYIQIIEQRLRELKRQGS